MHDYIPLADIAIGATVGAAIALTGGGGAIAGLPLFHHLGGMSHKDGSIALLPIVGMAAAIALIPHHKHTDSAVARRVGLGSIPTSWFAATIKPFIPNSAITVTVALVIIWGIYALHTSSQGHRLPAKSWHPIGLGILSGLLTGITGIGGGMIVVPFLKRYLHLSEESAVPTASVIIIINAIIGIASQHTFFLNGQLPSTDWAWLFGSCASASITISLAKKICPPLCHQRTVKIGYTTIGVIALISLFR